MKETFDIKYRPEIESGKYRVVTRRGEPVEILKWDAKGGDFPIVGLVTLIETDAQEPYSFMTDGRFDPNAVIDDLDLFVTNEPELTKFEKDLGWISVKDRLPEKDHFVITCVDDYGHPQSVGMAMLLEDGTWWDGDIKVYVDYWMEVPKFNKKRKEA